MGNHKNFHETFIKWVWVFFQETKEFKDSDLKERILNTSDFVLGIVLLSDHTINFSKLWDCIDNIFHKVFIKTDDVFKKSHGTEKDSMIFLIERGEDFGQ